MKKILLMGAVLPAMLLVGCGEGWESKLYNGFPYNNIRTAGHGIEYVRENMMPKKGPKIEAMKKETKMIIKEPAAPKKEEAVTDNVLNSGEKFFRDLQRK